MLMQPDFFFFVIYEETVKEWGWGFKKLKGISFPLSSTQQRYHVNNSTIIYLVEWKIAAAILVVNNPFSHSREPLPGQHLLSDFMIKLIKTVLFNSIFQRKIMPSTVFFFFWPKVPAVLEICTCSYMELKNPKYEHLILPHPIPPPVPFFISPTPFPFFFFTLYRWTFLT